MTNDEILRLIQESASSLTVSLDTFKNHKTDIFRGIFFSIELSVDNDGDVIVVLLYR